MDESTEAEDDMTDGRFPFYLRNYCRAKRHNEETQGIL